MFPISMLTRPPTIRFPRPVRQTLRWLVPDESVIGSQSANRDESAILRQARRLHESLRRLPPAPCGSARCLVVGSQGLEVPYLAGRLGWSDITCLTSPTTRPGETRLENRPHPNTAQIYPFTLVQHQLDSQPLPFADDSFSLIIYWVGIERLRHDPEFSLYELNRVCLPGGSISIVTDNAISLRTTQGILRGDPIAPRVDGPDGQRPWRHYTPTEIEDLLTGTGWRVDQLTTIVPDSDDGMGWWKSWRLRSLVRGLRRGSGLAEPFWNNFILAGAVKVSGPTRSYPQWLYQDEKIRQLKIEMLELVSRRAPARLAS